MPSPTPIPRKRVRHYDEPGHAHALTFSCSQRLPLLTSDPWLVLLSRSIDRATVTQHFQLVAFVYMPEHVHLVVVPDGAVKIARLLWAIKRPFSYRIKVLLKESQDPLLKKLMVQERPGKRVFRFWQAGPGYDRNIIFDQELHDVLRYIHNNPVRRGLCGRPGEWKWSSWKHYQDMDAVIDPDLPRLHGMPGRWGFSL